MFVFGLKSIAERATLHRDLAGVADAALARSTVDFGIVQGLRSDAAQLAAWKRGASKRNGIPKGTTRGGIKGTGRGNHQAHADGKARALDAAPWINGAFTDDWRWFFPLALAFHKAAKATGVRVRWGGVWDRVLNDLEWSSVDDVRREVDAYKARHAGPDFLDGYHFELA